MTGDEKTRNEQLVRKIRDGDENAFSELYERYQRELHGYIAKRIDDRRDVEELVQDTFVKVWEQIHTLKAPEKVLNWMYRIAAQLIAGWHRKPQRLGTAESITDVHEVEGETAASAVAYQTGKEVAIIAERADALYQAIAQLSEREQRMIRLQSEGKSYKEIAEICNVSVSVVRNALPRAKQKLQAWAEVWKAANAEGLDMEFSEVHKAKRRTWLRQMPDSNDGSQLCKSRLLARRFSSCKQWLSSF